MKFQDFDMAPIQVALDKVNEQGCTYASLQINCTGKTVQFNMYTPETSHHRFDDSESLIEHLTQIASEGDLGYAAILAKQKIKSARAAIQQAQEDIADAERKLSNATTDGDGVPV